MHILIYAGSLKVIPGERFSLIGTRSSIASFLGLSYHWGVPLCFYWGGGWGGGDSLAYRPRKKKRKWRWEKSLAKMSLYKLASQHPVQTVRFVFLFLLFSL